GSATSGADYEPLSGQATIPAGRSSVTVLVTPVDDHVSEDAETVNVTIVEDAAYVVGSPREATVTIEDRNGGGGDKPNVAEPPLVSVALTDLAASEGGPDSGTSTVSRSGSTASALTVNYTLSGTAANGVDYQNLSGSVTIPAGADSAPVVVSPVDDALF